MTQPTSTDGLLREAQEFANRNSDDPVRKVGALVTNRAGFVVAQGANWFPEMVPVTPARLAKKNLYMVHAEVNALRNMKGQWGTGFTLYLPWFPCSNCAKEIAMSRQIAKLVCTPPDKDGKWAEEMVVAEDILRTAGIDLEFVQPTTE